MSWEQDSTGTLIYHNEVIKRKAGVIHNTIITPRNGSLNREMNINAARANEKRESMKRVSNWVYLIRHFNLYIYRAERRVRH